MIALFIFYLLFLSSPSNGQYPLPPDTPTLQLRFPNTSWVTPGDTLLMSAAHPLPQIRVGTLNPDLTYVLLFVDLDVLYGATSTVILHWYQPNMVAMHQHEKRSDRDSCGSDEHHVLVNTTTGAEYIAPQPPRDSHHRYVYLLFEQKHEYAFPDCFGYIFPPTVEARAGFDVRQFIEVAGLSPPVAGNYFFVEYDGPLTATGTGTVSRATPTTTWMRSAPCSETGTARPTFHTRELRRS